MISNIHKQPIHWVDAEDQLVSLCETWETKKMLAIDTEFMRSQTYFPIAGLLQLNDGDANYLIDPTCINCEAFGAILRQPTIVKVIHSCSEDLEVFQHLLGCVPVNLLDTQIAAAMCGYGFSVGYGNLVKAVLGIDLPKGETRSDWLRRPLSQAQIEYAAIDVEFLYQLASVLIGALKDKQRLRWATEDCDQLLLSYAENQSIENHYLRIKQAWRLSSNKLAILKVLAHWREQEAQRRDVPRNRVIKEHSLLDIAMMAPTREEQLRKFEGITERMIRADGETIIQLVEQAKAVAPEQLPEPLPKPLSGSENKWSKTLRQEVLAIAELHVLAPELLLKKRDYEAITRHFIALENDDQNEVEESLQQFIRGWRYELLSEPLTNAICAGDADDETIN